MTRQARPSAAITEFGDFMITATPCLHPQCRHLGVSRQTRRSVQPQSTMQRPCGPPRGPPRLHLRDDRTGRSPDRRAGPASTPR